MALCVQYTNNFKVFERFLSFINVSENQNSQSLTSAIVCFLEKYNLHNVPIIAQSYDGASVISGVLEGVQKENSREVSICNLYSLYNTQNKFSCNRYVQIS